MRWWWFCNDAWFYAEIKVELITSFWVYSENKKIKCLQNI